MLFACECRAEEDDGLAELGRELLLALKMIRVYTESPREKLDDFVRADSVVLPEGSNVAEAADQIHKELAHGLK